MNKEIACLFDLLCCGIGQSEDCEVPKDVNWKVVYNIAKMQGVVGLMLDGLDRYYSRGKDIGLDFQTKMDWIGDVQQLEVIYTQHEKAIESLAKFYKDYGIKMMLLKGIGLSYDYPVPKHRPCGDIDIYLFGNQEKGDQLVHEMFGIEIDKDHHKHTVFPYEGVTIENHYDFANYYKHRSSKKLDDWLKQETERSLRKGNLWLPSPSFNAIFLVRHAASHFAAEQITLRHLLDWAFFVEKHYNEVDWEWQWEICKEQNMHNFLLAINNICVQNLGFDTSKFRTGGDDALTERVLNEILSSTFQEDIAKGNTIYIRCCRWWANRWKHKIVYPENLITTFFHQVYAHLMKPATIIR